MSRNYRICEAFFVLIALGGLSTSSAAANTADEAADIEDLLLRDDELTFTDYLSLYRLEGRWQIVAKIFHDHRQE